ncbi:MAG: hypothetical protein ACKV2Q_29285 [Planctomycetaceae bacterium]
MEAGQAEAFGASPSRFEKPANLIVGEFAAFQANIQLHVATLQVSQRVLAHSSISDQPAAELLDRLKMEIDRLLR